MNLHQIKSWPEKYRRWTLRLAAAFVVYSLVGFFLVPASRVVVSVLSSISQVFSPRPPPPTDVVSEVPDQLRYIEEHWPEVERVVLNALRQRKGSIRQYHLRALPLDEAGRISVLRRYARTYPEGTSLARDSSVGPYD